MRARHAGRAWHLFAGGPKDRRAGATYEETALLGEDGASPSIRRVTDGRKNFPGSSPASAVWGFPRGWPVVPSRPPSAAIQSQQALSSPAQESRE
jgi:hypothetical protein